MTRFIHDQFAKDYLEELLSPYGEVKPSRRVAGEVREIDVWFAPSPEADANLAGLGLLGRFARTPAIFEPFRNPANPDDICNCLLKLLEVRGDYQREANRNQTRIQESDLPKLWVLTPTASANLLNGFRAILEPNWLPGVYLMGDSLRTAIVVIHQLPRTAETLWLRLLGRGTVQKQAIDELEALPQDNPFRAIALEMLYNLRQNLQVNQSTDAEERELIMRLAPLYQQDREQAIREGEERGIQVGEQRGIQIGEERGIQQGQRQLIENFLRVRFGELDEELLTLIDPLLALHPEELSALMLQLATLSRDELLGTFSERD
ncbi:hypothetical protein NG796_20360 [Laspinema sp. A4]|uniref:hypothetical protein n=1 Tax=Laspinema sp. D2d TaxID=2953686 RepID=UPI0021BB8331|nr:hypothetical protein [Laspinema sp. D2d]MCT7985630.1 hypothetical protein [Laspinema sp. D2d]